VRPPENDVVLHGGRTGRVWCGAAEDLFCRTGVPWMGLAVLEGPPAYRDRKLCPVWTALSRMDRRLLAPCFALAALLFCGLTSRPASLPVPPERGGTEPRLPAAVVERRTEPYPKAGPGETLRLSAPPAQRKPSPLRASPLGLSPLRASPLRASRPGSSLLPLTDAEPRCIEPRGIEPRGI
jgi:hypothetical protein